MDINKKAKQYSDENWLIMEPMTTEKAFKAGAEWYMDNVVNKNDLLHVIMPQSEQLKAFCNHLNTYKGLEEIRFDFMLVDFLEGSKIKTLAKLIFCEKCVTCKYMNKMTGDCMNVNKTNWVDGDCKDYLTA